jgi:hypothetical protein
LDSRVYAFPYSFGALRDAPSDFELASEFASALVEGLFLPPCNLQETRGEFDPAKVVLLTPDTLWILAHPTAETSGIRLPLTDLEQLECGRVLLLGWIGLRATEGESILRYNRRSSGAVEGFLATLRARWLGAETGLAQPAFRPCGPEPSKKLQYVAATELATSGELLLVRLYSPRKADARWRRSGTRPSRGASLLMVTNRRLLQITEQRERVFEPYGTYSRSVRLGRVRDVLFERMDDSRRIRAILATGDVWDTMVDPDCDADAGRFLEAVHAVMRNAGAPVPSKAKMREATGAA